MSDAVVVVSTQINTQRACFFLTPSSRSGGGGGGRSVRLHTPVTGFVCVCARAFVVRVVIYAEQHLVRLLIVGSGAEEGFCVNNSSTCRRRAFCRRLSTTTTPR